MVKLWRDEDKIILIQKRQYLEEERKKEKEKMKNKSKVEQKENDTIIKNEQN